MRLILALALVLPLAAQWPQFRGPGGQGHSNSANPPLTWSEADHITWKTILPGKGWSSPVIQDGAIWLTTATENGHSLRALAVDASSGSIVTDIEIFRVRDLQSKHNKNSHASPTPILDGKRVYVHFGAQGTAALDTEGNVLWRNNEHTFRQGHGTGGSPVLHDNLLIFNSDGTDRQFVIALDSSTGRSVWRTSRGRGRMGYSTPLIIPAASGSQLVSTGGDRAVSYDPASGRELWWVTYNGFSLVPRPVYGRGLVYLTSGFHEGVLFAIHPDGRGDITGTEKVAWTWNRGVPMTPSPILIGDEFYMVSDRGIATCLDAKTGKQIWRERLDGGYSASPVTAAGRVYFLNESGLTTVIRSGPEFEVLARNQLDGSTLASIAIDGDTIYLRSETALYRID